MTIQPGDIGFVMHNDNKLSKLIAWFMGSRWSHSFIVYEVYDTQVFLIETSDFEVTYGILRKYERDDAVTMEIWSPIDASIDVRQKAIQNCESHVGQVYAYWQLLSLGLRRMCLKVGVKIKNLLPFGDVCDQEVLEGANIYDGLIGTDPKSIDTQDLYEMVSTCGHFKLVSSK